MEQIQKKEYYKNLDTVRCFAAISVIVYHWLPDLLGAFPLAKFGVDLFFVLSGFLITEILLRSKRRIGASGPGTGSLGAGNGTAGNRTIGSVLKSFYIKRSLRIFPIYYLLIGLLFLCHVPAVVDNWPYLVTYTSNFHMFLTRKWMPPVSHLWSLAVEEQFYIVWPFLILLIRGKWLSFLIGGVILLSLAFVLLSPAKDEFFFMLPFTCISTLGAGALLAYIKNETAGILEKIGRWSLPAALASGIVFCIWYASFSFFIWHILIAFFSFCLIAYCITSSNRGFNRAFSNPVTSYLGKISYGLYLYHNPIPSLVRGANARIGRMLGHSFEAGQGILLLESLVVLLAATGISWFFFEKPINSLKAKFQ
jgi:peptidoglycan/LPS O-acetylase OafA/YrhL